MSSPNARDPMLANGSDRCRCPSCGLYFNSTFAFDRHRKGRIGTSERRCMAADELTASGWCRTETGHWISARRPAGTVRCDAGAAIGPDPLSGGEVHARLPGSVAGEGVI